jgi:hypothetical protein
MLDTPSSVNDGSGEPRETILAKLEIYANWKTSDKLESSEVVIVISESRLDLHLYLNCTRYIMLKHFFRIITV